MKPQITQPVLNHTRNHLFS